MLNIVYPAFNTYHLSFKSMPTNAGYTGPVESRRKSPVLSRQELQRLILDMVD